MAQRVTFVIKHCSQWKTFDHVGQGITVRPWSQAFHKMLVYRIVVHQPVTLD